MGILEYHEHRLTRRQCFELGQERRQRHVLAGLRSHFGEAIAVAERKRQKIGQGRHHAVCIGAKPQEQSFKLGKLLRRRLASLEPGGTFEVDDEWIQRTVGVVRRAEVPYRNVWFGLEPLLKRQRDMRLTDTRLSS
jgi:hypothetical protein